MTAKLKEYFPMIREKEEVLAEIRKDSTLHTKFKSWTPEQQEEFLNLCTGVRALNFYMTAFSKRS